MTKIWNFCDHAAVCSGGLSPHYANNADRHRHTILDYIRSLAFMLNKPKNNVNLAVHSWNHVPDEIIACRDARKASFSCPPCNATCVVFIESTARDTSRPISSFITMFPTSSNNCMRDLSVAVAVATFSNERDRNHLSTS